MWDEEQIEKHPDVSTQILKNSGAVIPSILQSKVGFNLPHIVTNCFYINEDNFNMLRDWSGPHTFINDVYFLCVIKHKGYNITVD